jgi:4-hydroxy-4-methyl-2-oxoglutarate aldolase
MTRLTIDQLNEIRQFDTCSVLNAIETFDVRLRNDGYARPGLRWMFPAMDSMIGYAATLCVKTSNPPISGSAFNDRTDWWNDLSVAEGPLIAVIQDIDEETGLGAVAGDVHVAILQRLGCVGLVTNGSVRDLGSVEQLGLPLYAGSVSPSHAYEHIVDHNQPVDISGLRINPGDLLYSDRNGLISIPMEIAADIPAVVRRLREKDRRIIEFCRSTDFSVERLVEEVK